MEYGELERLERIVENLLGEFGRLKQVNERLESSLFVKEQENKELRDSVSRLQGERSLVHNRVTLLISSLERWEETQTGALQQADAAPEFGEKTSAPHSPVAGGLGA